MDYIMWVYIYKGCFCHVKNISGANMILGWWILTCRKGRIRRNYILEPTCSLCIFLRGPRQCPRPGCLVGSVCYILCVYCWATNTVLPTSFKKYYQLAFSKSISLLRDLTSKSNLMVLCLLFKEKNTAEIGVVIRDDKGQVMASMTEKILLPSSVAIVEAMEGLAAIKALTFAQDIGLSSLIL